MSSAADLQMTLLQIIYQFLDFPLPDIIYALIPLALSVISCVQVNLGQKLDKAIPNPPPDSGCDYIVVGSGAAGAIVANRLSESGDKKVCLLEAGGYPTIPSMIPGVDLYNAAINYPTWNYYTEPQKYGGRILADRRVYYPLGKCLGGTTNMNFMIWVCGNQYDYQEWANECGDQDWNYPNLIKFFKKIENYHGNYPNDSYHGTNGNIYISKQAWHAGLDEFCAAGEEMGFPVRDTNNYQTEEFSRSDANIKDGRRWGTYQGYILPAISRGNFKFWLHALVDKVIFDENKNAVAVQYIRNGQIATLKAKIEIIICGGAIGSPPILMRSGIGPAGHLKKMGIDLLVNRTGVGENLQEHPATFPVYTFNWTKSAAHPTKPSLLLQRDVTIASIINWAFWGGGPLGSNHAPGIAFYSPPGCQKDWPSVQLYEGAFGIFPTLAPEMDTFFSMSHGTFNKLFNGIRLQDANFLGSQCSRVFSRGTVRLASKDPAVDPLFDPNLLGDPRDLKCIIEGLKKINEMVKTKAYKGLNPTQLSNSFPNCEQFANDMESDAYLECYAKDFTAVMHHHSGTCKMGKTNDPLAVVDSHLRVIGVNRLRVCDASIMPLLINGNTNCPSMMIGEKGAQYIKNDHP